MTKCFLQQSKRNSAFASMNIKVRTVDVFRVFETPVVLGLRSRSRRMVSTFYVAIYIGRDVYMLLELPQFDATGKALKRFNEIFLNEVRFKR